MAKTVFEPARTVEKKLIEMDSQQLCEFASKLCGYVETEVGSKSYRGGIFPENISLSDKGELALGPAAAGNWQGRELDFLAPELYWRGKPSAASDVYSIGLLLYYSLSGGLLPLEDECQDAQLRRMAGDDFKAPKGTGRRLAEILEKAIKFKASQRYQSLGEMKAALDSCIKNLYLNGEPSAEAIFKKNDDELSEVERMMVGIIEKDDEAVPEEEGEDVKLFSPSTPIADAKSAARVREQSNMLSRKLKQMSNPAVPKLKEELNPELAPISPERHTNTIPPVQYTRDMEREKKIAQDAKKRQRRPLAVILGLCVALIIIAIIFNAMLKDFQEAREKEAARATPTVDPLIDDPVAENASDPYELFTRDEEGNVIPIESKRPDALEVAPLDVSAPAREHSYELVIEDIS